MTKKEMKARLAAIRKEAEQAQAANDGEKLDALLAEAQDINAKLENADKLDKLSAIAADHGDEGDGEGEERKDAATKRGELLMKGAKVKMKAKEVLNTISSTTTAMTKHTAADVKDTFNSVSGLVDAVKVINFPGGESYTRGYVKSYGEGDYTAEGGDAATAEPATDYVEINKAKITAYCEEPEEIVKLAPSAYDDVISGSVARAVRRKLSRQIVAGAGTSNTLTGIFNAPAKVINGDTDVEISAITESTLDEIIYAYGGDEEVEGACGLILNKLDLKAFATLRNADGKKVYNVVNNGNTGTIDGIPYIINSACPALSKAATTAGTKCMAYGPFENYELAVFSDLEVQHSTEFKFKSGQIAHRAEVFAGGNVAAYNGFVRVKKVAAN